MYIFIGVEAMESYPQIRHKLLVKSLLQELHRNVVKITLKENTEHVCA